MHSALVRRHRDPYRCDGEAAVERRVLREHARRDGYREVAPVLGELPPIGRGVGRRVPSEAVVLGELSRVRRSGVAKEVLPER